MTRKYRKLSECITSGAWMALLASSGISCGRVAARDENGGASMPAETASISLALQSADQSSASDTTDLRLDFTPPGNVYMTSFSATFPYQGVYPHTVYLYQPEASEQHVRLNLRSEIAGTHIQDSGTVFRNVRWVRHPDQPSPTEEELTAAPEGDQYDAETGGRGWYALTFEYAPQGSNRALAYGAFDAQGKALKTAWVAPSGRTSKFSANFQVSTPEYVYFKGGAFSGASIQQFAYTDNIRIDGQLLYRKGFDQGLFNYPVGYLATQTHTLEFDFEAWSGAPSQSWFGVSQVGFDPKQRELEQAEGSSGVEIKTRWEPLQVLYRGSMHTADYDAWSEGVAFAQSTGTIGSGSSSFPKLGVRPPPVRRGTTFSVALEHDGLSESGSNATLEIAAADTNEPVQWQRAIAPMLDYAGGVFTEAGWSARDREHWEISIPMDAPIGRYVLRAFAPDRTSIGSDVLFYVIHNPHAYIGIAGLSMGDVESYGYDEDEDGLGWNLASAGTDVDQDHQRDNFVVVVNPPGVDENGIYVPEAAYTGTAVRAGAFRRTSERSQWDHSLLDYAMASSQGATTEFETMLRLLRFVNQRATYSNQLISTDAEGGLGAFSGEDPGRTLALAHACSQPGYESTECVHGAAVCYTFASRLAAIARSTGLLARAINSGTHAVTEAYLPTPPNGTSFSDSDRWYVFDATDHMSNPAGPYADQYDPNTQPSQFFYNQWEAVAPRGQYCLAQKFTTYMSARTTDACNWITTSLDWQVPEVPGYITLPSTAGKILTAEYNTSTGYWIPRSGVTGWLAFGDKDVYRLDKSSLKAEYIRVSAQPSSGGSNLLPELCIVPSPLEVGATQFKQRCSDAANVRRIPDGESYVVVFNDSANLSRYHGDVVQYLIEVGDGVGWARCDDGIQNGQELAIDCGGNCPGCGVGQPCKLANDCESLACNYGKSQCVPACTVETAVDLGAPGKETIVPSDGCVRVDSGYPSWWGTRSMSLISSAGGPYPIPFKWTQLCPDSSSTSGGTFSADWQSVELGPIDSACPTLIDLRGDGSSNITLRYYGL